MRNHAAAGKIGFGINHEMRDFKTGRKKNLDLVICTPGSVNGGKKKKPSFAELVKVYDIELTGNQQTVLAGLPPLPNVPVGSVHVALEAKAAMTAHIRALPRLYDELNSSHLAIHGAADFAIATGFVVVNFAATFISPKMNPTKRRTAAFEINTHNQPNDTTRTIDKVMEIPRRTQQGAEGFDALGLVVIEMVNDGSPVKLVSTPPAPPLGHVLHYDQLIRRVASLYATKFGNI